MASQTFRVRFRFRVLKRLAIEHTEHSFMVGGREVSLRPPADGVAINASEWLVMNTRGFATEIEARAFAEQLRAAAELSSAAARLGIDAGRNLATSGLAASLRDQLRQESGVEYRGSVHGVDVFADEPNVRFMHLSATGAALATPGPFLDGLAALLLPSVALSNEARNVVLLLNYALMRPEPVAQIVFSVSAVEMLGQQEQQWSPAQKQLLTELKEAARKSSTGSESERAEVADAVSRGLQRVSLRQGVVRLLGKLGIERLKKQWDSLYSERSELVHGLAPQPGADYTELADRTVRLCGYILLKFIAREIPIADQHAETFYGGGVGPHVADVDTGVVDVRPNS